jgi:hypothetical protein
VRAQAQGEVTDTETAVRLGESVALQLQAGVRLLSNAGV